MKSVHIPSFFWSVFSLIRTEYRLEKTPNADTFHEVFVKEIDMIKPAEAVLHPWKPVERVRMSHKDAAFFHLS